MRALLPSLFLTYAVQCANILFVGFYPSRAHQSIFQLIWKELSLRGHQVTVLSPNPIKDPSLINLTEIDLSDVYRIEGTRNAPPLRSKEFHTKEGIIKLFDFMETIVQYQLCNPEVRSLIMDKRKTFEVAIIEVHHPAMLGFGYRLNCPVIGISSSGVFTNTYEAVGNPTHPVLYPDLAHQKRSKISMRADEIAKMHFGMDVPYVGDLEKNISVLMLNVNPLMYTPRPYLPNVVNLGHIYLKSDQELSKEFKEELDEAKEGVIYINLENSIPTSNMTNPLLAIIVRDLSDLPYKIVWKWEYEYLPGRPENVVIKKWIPQQAILGHRNVKAFVTHGNLQSVEEAIMSGVPLVGMPFADDQDVNVDEMVRAGTGLRMDAYKLKRGQLRKAILEVAENRKYRENMIKAAEIITDDSMTGVERAVWWTEYVIRHKGADNLRSPVLDLPLYQYYLLDVITFTLIGVLLIVFTAYKVLKIVFNNTTQSKKKRKKKSKRKKRKTCMELVQFDENILI